MKMTTQEALIWRAALHALDGLEQPVEVQGRLQLIKKPFKFAGRTRLKIARNLRAAEAVYQDYEAARNGLVRELAEGGERVPVEKLPQFQQRHGEMLREEMEVESTLLAEDELNLDDNEIPHGALAVLLTHLSGEK